VAALRGAQTRVERIVLVAFGRRTELLWSTELAG
jgi:hypothetical protein